MTTDVDTLTAAVEHEAPIEFTYQKGYTQVMGDTVPVFQQRVVSPYKVKEATDSNLLLVGWDHDREAIRQFEIAKIEDVKGADVEFAPPVELGRE